MSNPQHRFLWLAMANLNVGPGHLAIGAPGQIQVGAKKRALQPYLAWQRENVNRITSAINRALEVFPDTLTLM